MDTPWSVLVLGCGNIAGGFDQERPEDALPYTHAGAYRLHGGFSLLACVEPDAERRAAFMRRWSVPAGFSNMAQAVAAGVRADVVSICTPTACHATDLAAVLASLHPRLVFCEKPVTGSVDETAALVEQCERLGVALAVNHNRRWDPALRRLRDDIRSGKRGSLRSVVGLYNKGILNNGSHMLDLLRFLLGELDIVSVGQPVADYSDSDPTLPLTLRGADGTPIVLACGDARDFALFELQFVFSSGVVSVEDGGSRWRERRAVPSADFAGYVALDEGQMAPGGDAECMLAAVDNIHGYLAHGAELASTGYSALAAQRLCEQARQMAHI